MKKPLRHLLDYLVLCLLVSTGIVLILIYNGNPIFQRFVVLGISLLYIIWGIVHHLKEHTYHSKIVAEYALFALLGSIIVIGLF